MDISHGNNYIPTFFTMFLLVYLFAYFVLCPKWGPKHRLQASSCFISLAHGAPAVVMATHAIITSTSSSSLFSDTTFIFSSPNTKFQNLVLEYSISYFLSDLLHLILFYPHDILFISHHLATLYVFTTCRFLIGHGAVSILMLLALAEVTSPCQNVWSLAGLRKGSSTTYEEKIATKVYEFLSPWFYGLYSVCRVVLGPVFVWKMLVFYAGGGGDGVLGNWAWISWMLVIVCAVLVSILWVVNNWVDWFRSRSHKESKVN